MLDVSFFNVRQHRQFQHSGGPLLLARRTEGDETWLPVDSERAKLAETLLEITPAGDGIRMQLAGCEQECFCGRPCELAGSCSWTLPACFNIGDTRFEIAAGGHKTSQRRPLETLQAGKQHLAQRRADGPGPSPVTLSRWFYSLGMLNHWGRSSQEFFVQAARCAVESIGLDGAIVLRRRAESWEIVASHLPMPELGIHCDMNVLDELLNSPRTMFHGAAHASKKHEMSIDRATRLVGQLAAFDASAGDAMSSTFGGEEEAEDVDVVASPLCNASRELTGAIYGFRSVRAGNARRGIRYLEAHLIELLANAVTEGIVRLEHEAESERRQVLLQRANLSTSENDLDRTAVEQREITLLFADLRGSAGLANLLGSQETYELMGEVMDVLTAAVLDHDGLIIDYYGDGLAAMWNAPADQPEHAELACRTAIAMIEALPAVSEKWAKVLPDELRIGVGVHTGVAQVGNAGSSRRAKYGPRGANVNLASRIEGATKAIGAPLVVSQATATRLSNRFQTGRLCRAQLAGIDRPVDLFGVWPATNDTVAFAEMANYQRALELFELGELEAARQLVGEVEGTSGQLPTAFLAAQIEQALGAQQRRRSSDPAGPASNVIALNGK